LLSWGLPFGVATRRIMPGNYVCNEAMIEALQGRAIDFEIPRLPNFRDHIPTLTLEEGQFQAGKQVPLYAASPDLRGPGEFLGFRRSPARGVGTRNMILILGTTSRTGSYARLLETRLQRVADRLPNIDGIVAISHTEGSGHEPLHNREFLLSALSGFMVHANVGAVLAIDSSLDQISNETLREYMVTHRYPLEEVMHRFLTLSGDFQEDLATGEAIIRNWLDKVNGVSRTRESLSHLKVALQCGGSDAFSGVSGNPLASAVAREILRHGGSANLAETDELIGAEPYMLENVRDLETAQAFLDTIARFKERLSWHGVTAEGNPSGGNRYRGLYNVVLKSIGAAMKRHPEVRLDYVIDYGQRMEQPGFYFMNTPGNDLESISGQVGGGSNLILFVTGNGSITNFPLVPTIKIMTTTSRYLLLAREMDINAGAFQDGAPMADLARSALELTIAVASGQRTAGEKAGHAQVSIWRNWRQQDASQLEVLLARPKPSGKPIPIDLESRLETSLPARFQAIRSSRGVATDQIGLILPTSLCAGQIARMAAAHLNQAKPGHPHRLSRFVALVHTEGCGVAVGQRRDLYDRTMVSYMTHPMVRFGLFLEHGCEKTHNDYMRHLLANDQQDPGGFGWASVQLDGGIEPVLGKITTWFSQAIAASHDLTYESVGLEHLSLGLLSVGPVPDPLARCLARLARWVVAAGGSVTVPQVDPLLVSAAFAETTLAGRPAIASLAYGQLAMEKGFHLMETPSNHWVETLTGLGATGVEVLLAYTPAMPQQAHPFIPLIQITGPSPDRSSPTTDFDMVLQGDPALWPERTLRLVLRVASRSGSPDLVTEMPRLFAQGNVDFQITRGLLGIST
jgi:altronate dehydratase